MRVRLSNTPDTLDLLPVFLGIEYSDGHPYSGKWVRDGESVVCELPIYSEDFNKLKALLNLQNLPDKDVLVFAIEHIKALEESVTNLAQQRGCHCHRCNRLLSVHSFCEGQLCGSCYSEQV